MRLPDQRKILREDIKTKESWVPQLIDPINSFFNLVYIALNKNITFDENIRSIIKEVTVTTPSTYPTDQVLVKFPNSLTVKASGVSIIQCYERELYMPVTTENPAWVEDNGVISISAINGLTASKTYIVRFLVI